MNEGGKMGRDAKYSSVLLFSLMNNERRSLEVEERKQEVKSVFHREGILNWFELPKWTMITRSFGTEEKKNVYLGRDGDEEKEEWKKRI